MTFSVSTHTRDEYRLQGWSVEGRRWEDLENGYLVIEDKGPPWEQLDFWEQHSNKHIWEEFRFVRRISVTNTVDFPLTRPS